MLNYLVAFTVAVSAVCISSDPVSALDIRSSGCKSIYKKYQKFVGYKAFALSKDRRGCGHGSRYASKQGAAKRAMEECRKTKLSGCKIVHEALNKDVATDPCRKNLRKFQNWPGRKAFAVATSGGCGYSWDGRSRHSAIRSALSACREHNPRSKCFVIRQK